MCIYFTGLKKSYSKNPYPLPHTDRLINEAYGFRLLGFMDAYSSYNKIGMSPVDAPKTAFMTNISNYYYEVMTFGLKNVWVTYQSLMVFTRKN